jgi:putative nucleotidyltransferase with HDIG domain
MYILETYNDSIYGVFQLDEICDYVIKHEYFQRLRNIKQLGLSYKVFQNAIHSRYEHSIGVAYLCKLAGIQLNLDEKLVKLVTLAGLLHDIGHGPQSHLFDSYLKNIFYDDKEYYEHEVRSVEIFKKMREDSEFLRYNLNEEEVIYICDMILGNTGEKLLKERCIIEILNNKKSKIDLDKLDYLNRDTHYYDYSIKKLDYLGIINSLRIININGLYELCYSYELKSEIDELFERRFNNHYNIYQNLEVKIWELSYLDHLSQYENEIKNIFSNNFNIDNFCKLTDDIFKINKCDYKSFGESFQNKSEFTIASLLRNTSLICKDFTVNHGSRDKNPVNDIIFYGKNNIIIRIEENNKNYEENYKYLCYKDDSDVKNNLEKYSKIYNELVVS